MGASKMKKLLFSSAMALGLAAFALPVGTGQAAPAGPVGLDQPGPGAEPAQVRRRKAKRKVMRRRGSIARRAAPSQEGNADNPNVPVNQQRQGGTTGGPRF